MMWNAYLMNELQNYYSNSYGRKGENNSNHGGSVSVQFGTNNEVVKLDLIIHFLSFSGDLLSVSHLCDSVYGVVFTKTTSIVYQGGKVFGKDSRVDNIYKILVFHEDRQGVYVAVDIYEDSIDFWHNRSVHLSNESIKKMKSSDPVKT